MYAWRIDRAKRTQDESFSGEGARLFGGRWNPKGSRCVYTSESLALAALEKFVHTEEAGKTVSLVYYKIEIPPSVAIFQPQTKDLPKNWRAEPVPSETMELGLAWLNAGKAAILRIPSAIIPTEYNILINPVHTHFDKIKVIAKEPFTFDERLWK